jgi:hypothetical protein
LRREDPKAMGRKPLRQARLAESPIPARCFSDSGRNRGELREMKDDPPGPPIPPLTAPRRGVQARSRPHSGRLNQMPKGNAGVAHSRTGGVLAAEGCAPPVMEIWIRDWPARSELAAARGNRSLGAFFVSIPALARPIAGTRAKGARQLLRQTLPKWLSTHSRRSDHLSSSCTYCEI